MDIWESYESLPPLERIITTFAVTAILVVVIFMINKKVKSHLNISPGIIGTTGNLERKPDGTLLAYIAFWRYLIFGAMFAGAFCMCIYGFVVLYQELPSGFYKHWNKQATVTFLAPVLATAMFLLAGSFILPWILALQPLTALGVLKRTEKQEILEKVKLNIQGSDLHPS
ncbi:hypothetical protein IM793_12550 [Pedobacter sp. MR2016-19]|uniref:hypothetical protein n=1 Tax=Pedobacter sp. MR2016-19 TaxID=2780089 RepID=UPI0018739289|nr:hypothetical protein [Pedobacter sp. MR2016-19]MBE5319994.1 hypothetical protein [Pedobacter sp. MR2016-19]